MLGLYLFLRSYRCRDVVECLWATMESVLHLKEVMPGPAQTPRSWFGNTL